MSKPESFKTKIQSFIGTCFTAVFVCFLGAGAANVGWKTFDPMAIALAGAHGQDQAKLAQDAYENRVKFDAIQDHQLDEFKRSMAQTAESADRMRLAMQKNESLIAHEAREKAAKNSAQDIKRVQLLPEQESRE